MQLGGRGLPKILKADWWMFAQLSELQVENVKVHKLSEEQQELKSRLSEAEEARIQAQDQVCAPDQDCSGPIR